MTADRDLLQLGLRHDLVTFIQRTVQTVSPGVAYAHNWHIEAIAHHLERCFRGEIKRLIITVPPRHLKSICASVAFPAWALGRDPAKRVICVSYGNELTVKHARDCRAVMESAWYKAAFPAARIDPRKNTELEFETTQKGYRYGTSLGGALTGRGGNIIIVDDPMKPGDAMSDTKREAVKQWFDGTLYSRLDNKKDDVIIIVMQRLHVDDLVGHVLKKEPWVHLDLPAIAELPQEIPIGDGQVHRRAIGDVLHPDREPRAVLDQLKANIGSQVFSAQYQQRPVPAGGNMIKADWLKTYSHPPAYGADGRIVQSWDTASKAGELNDYSVCTTWLIKGEQYYLLDVMRARLEYPFLKRRVIEWKRRFAAHTVLIEDKGSGTQLIQDLRHERTGVNPIAIMPERDKVTRMWTQADRIEAGQVWLPQKAPWLDDLRAELLAFPDGAFDDQVDSVSQFLNWAVERTRNRIRWGRTIGAI